jgi:NAD+ diphosphatase
MYQPENLPPQDNTGAVQFVFHRGQLVTDMRAAEPLLLPRHNGDWQVIQEQFLGYWLGQPVYAVELHESETPDPMQYQRGNLYQILGRVEDQLFALAGRALQLLAWERDHQYCGRCGQQMAVDKAERAMRCDPCKTTIYPRIAPCAITLVTRGEEMLLARNANFPRPMYSTLAGFIEAGESAEETVIREVKEEVGVDVGNLHYFGSQPWPFPNQLMLAYIAEYQGGDIVCDLTEIADAQWFHFSELPQVPPPTSIAGQMIADFVHRHSNR